RLFPRDQAETGLREERKPEGVVVEGDRVAVDVRLPIVLLKELGILERRGMASSGVVGSEVGVVGHERDRNAAKVFRQETHDLAPALEWDLVERCALASVPG